jgi:hypothetical protein
LSFTTNKTGRYDWVDITKGFSSACAWYIFTKHGFNPFTFDRNLPTDVNEENPIKLNYNLEQNYPNPFNPSTKICWQSSVGSHQSLKVYDVLGNEISTLLNEYRDAGTYSVEFGIQNSDLCSGVYFYQLKAGDYLETKKMILLK